MGQGRRRGDLISCTWSLWVSLSPPEGAARVAGDPPEAVGGVAVLTKAVGSPHRTLEAVLTFLFAECCLPCC